MPTITTGLTTAMTRYIIRCIMNAMVTAMTSGMSAISQGSGRALGSRGGLGSRKWVVRSGGVSRGGRL
ncbi:hypothetical protein VSR01_14835 [Actinacidiphila sp. DG2A-62]|uniref:hypothetical protein n=1 Tax=Actinacidiphila sp. DG2A-62 TaxID=3108821 RepID=UPI002DBEDA65|nr:hypothetical protein [Actinacidiphila sp. DG2A-62]MEC3994733.1 hypothetical protein [Actinacidiphila sp. DG2A-62]